MRFHYSFQVSKLLRDLKELGAPLRRAIEALRHNPIPEDARAIPERPGRYEIHVRVSQRGYWVIYEIDESGSETVITVSVIEPN